MGQHFSWCLHRTPHPCIDTAANNFSRKREMSDTLQSSSILFALLNQTSLLTVIVFVHTPHGVHGQKLPTVSCQCHLASVPVERPTLKNEHVQLLATEAVWEKQAMPYVSKCTMLQRMQNASYGTKCRLANSRGAADPRSRSWWIGEQHRTTSKSKSQSSTTSTQNLVKDPT